MKLDFSRLAQLRVREFDSLTELEKTVLLLWREVNGYEHIAMAAAVELATMQTRTNNLEALLREVREEYRDYRIITGRLQSKVDNVLNEAEE